MGPELALVSHVLAAPKDDDGDKIPDKWEKEQVEKWNSQYGGPPVTVDITFFNDMLDNEKADPDGAGNWDGGRNTPAQKKDGDSLTVLQEFRGFVVAAGGGGYRTPSADAGHRRLLPWIKELLVEVDVMKDVAALSGVDVNEVMSYVAQGFADIHNGAGIDLYWVVQEKAAAREIFDDSVDQVLWAAGDRHKFKGEFVHLMFVDDRRDIPDTRVGATSPTGVFVYGTNAKGVHTPGFATRDFEKMLSHIAGHEIGHALLGSVPKVLEPAT